ncbi:hypothetical protein GCM10027066_09840 [Dyella jejuensis]
MFEDAHHATHDQAAAEVGGQGAQGQGGKKRVEQDAEQPAHPASDRAAQADGKKSAHAHVVWSPDSDRSVPRQQARLRRRNPVVQASSTFRWFAPARDGRHAISLMLNMLADAMAG